MAVDTESQLTTAVDVLPGNAPDNQEAPELAEKSDTSVHRRRKPVVETLGDTAYGEGGSRQVVVDTGRNLLARLPGRPNPKCLLKEDFIIDLPAGSRTCPVG